MVISFATAVVYSYLCHYKNIATLIYSLNLVIHIYTKYTTAVVRVSIKIAVILSLFFKPPSNASVLTIVSSLQWASMPSLNDMQNVTVKLIMVFMIL